MNTINRLLSASQSVWNTYYQHPFVLGLQNGTLDPAKFRHYILQDYLYLIEYAKVFAIGLSKAKSLPVMQLFSSYIQSIVHSEMTTHTGYMEKLNIRQEELMQTPVALSNRSYTAYMMQEAYMGGEAETLTAILSCAYSYEAIGHKIIRENPDAVNHAMYGDWVRYYSGEPYHQDNLRLLNMLEALTKDYTEPQLCHLEQIFLTCSRYESQFWDMAWESAF